MTPRLSFLGLFGAAALTGCGQPESVTVEEEDAAMPMGGESEAERYGEVVSEEAATGEATVTDPSSQEAADPGDMETVAADETGM